MNNQSKIPKLSVIVPLYNSELGIRDTLNALFLQTLSTSNFEIIVVDDYSTDRSLEAAKEFSRHYAGMITFIEHGANKGPGGARNTGMNHAKGQYITFIDAGDTLDARAYETYLNIAMEKDANLTCFPFNLEENGERKTDTNPRNIIFQQERVISGKNLPEYPAFIFSMHPWNKIYSTKLIQKINPFLEKQLHCEDSRFSFEAFTNARTIAFSNKALYNYIKSPGQPSITASNYSCLESLSKHLEYHLYLKDQKKIFPEHAQAINWFHRRNWFPFFEAMMKDQYPSDKDSQRQLIEDLYRESRLIFLDEAIKDTPQQSPLYIKLMISTYNQNETLEEAMVYYKRKHQVLSTYYDIKRILLFWRRR